MEIAEISPWILSDEKPLAVRSSSGNVQVASFLHDGQLLIIAVNILNSPQKFDIKISGSVSGSSRVIFENRSIPLNTGTFSDYIPSFGSQVYLINTKLKTELIKPYRGILNKDPGFEDMSNPGVPASCYAWNEGDRGSTFFTDSREHLEGNHSLRLVTPRENKGTRLRFYPIEIKKGRSYVLSVWAKTDSDPEGNGELPCFELGLGGYGKKRFSPGPEWQQFVTSVIIPGDTINSSRENVILRLPGKGTAWFDMIQVFEAKEIKRSVNPEFRKIWEY
jgi:hypothetical protein